MQSVSGSSTPRDNQLIIANPLRSSGELLDPTNYAISANIRLMSDRPAAILSMALKTSSIAQ
jgi:hypothetical protein